MNNTIQQFEYEKKQAKNLLKKLSSFLSEGEVAGITIDENMKTKINTAQESIEEGVLKVALIGGFSEGKTSIAAAWMEKLDKKSMNISQQESSNEVKLYNIGSDCVLIDTPGLFGFKEQFNIDTKSIEKYKDMTKKYVSEAHLVLYVMNSTNPIKESHQDDLKWLFRDLNLLNRTVFVLSRFDEVADVEDSYEYNEHFKIKKNNVISRLNDCIRLSQEEKYGLSIVAVSANPFDMGTEYWLKNPEKFRQLSHIEKLQTATEEKLLSNGGQMAIAIESANSVIRDIIYKKMPAIVNLDHNLGDELDRMQCITQRLSSQMITAKDHISDVKIGLRRFATTYFSDLILQANGMDIETSVDFFEREVGDGGIIIEVRIQNEFESHLNGVSVEIEKIKSDFNNEIKHYNTAIKMLGKSGLSFIKNNNVINNTSILAGRNSIVSVAKGIGIDLSSALKFKPWGAVNMANKFNGALAIAGVALEVWNSWKEAQQREEFEKSKIKMIKNFEQQRSDLLDLINSTDFSEKFFPDYLLLQQESKELQDNMKSLAIQRQKFSEWKKMGEAIEAEIRAI